MLTVDVYHPVISDWKLLPRSIRIIVTDIMFTLHPQFVYNAYNIFTITQISPTEPLHFYVANFRRITTCCLIPHQSVIAIKTISHRLMTTFGWMKHTYHAKQSVYARRRIVYKPICLQLYAHVVHYPSSRRQIPAN